ncbi:MAG: FISUMP domain-containing protein [Chlorobiaceae bacterium]
MKEKRRAIYRLVTLAAILAGATTSVLVAKQATLTDIDSNSYNTVAVGNRIWAQENLNVSRYRNGDAIPQAKTLQEWQAALRKGEGAWCYYGNLQKNGQQYGKLYNWFAVNDPRGLAPSGTHIPTKQEWETLAKDLPTADNSIRFKMLPAGLRNYVDEKYSFLGEGAYFWSSSEHDENSAWYMTLNAQNKSAMLSAEEKYEGLSVRVIKD